MLNPDKYIRKYFYNYLISQGIACYDSRQGLEYNTIYVLLSTQSKLLEQGNKCGLNYDATIVLEIIQVRPKQGNAGSRLVINDVEESVINAYISAEIENFNITNKDYNTNDLVTYGLNETIKRTIITINFKLYEQ